MKTITNKLNITEEKKAIALAMGDLLDKIEELEKVLPESDIKQIMEGELTEEIKEKLEAYDMYIEESSELYTMSEAAKLLGFGRNRTFKCLRDMGVLLTDMLKNENIMLTHNDPSQYAINQGYFRVLQADTKKARNNYGFVVKVDVTDAQANYYGNKVMPKRRRTQTVVTKKGLNYILKVLKEKGYIYKKREGITKKGEKLINK